VVGAARDVDVVDAIESVGVVSGNRSVIVDAVIDLLGIVDTVDAADAYDEHSFLVGGATTDVDVVDVVEVVRDISDGRSVMVDTGVDSVDAVGASGEGGFLVVEAARDFPNCR